MKTYTEDDLVQVINFLHAQYTNNNQATRSVNSEILSIKTSPDKVWTTNDIVELLERQIDMFEIFHVFVTSVESKFMEMVPSLIKNEITNAVLKSNIDSLKPNTVALSAS